MDQATIPKASPIVRDESRCYGCRTCELACSFHHTGAFAPEASSIKIFRSNPTAVMTCRVEESCDACFGESLPLCVKYCAYGALRKGGRS